MARVGNVVAEVSSKAALQVSIQVWPMISVSYSIGNITIVAQFEYRKDGISPSL